MRTAGLIGGISWVSTVEYYRMLNETVNKELGGNNAARSLIYSVNYQDIIEFNKTENWEGIAALLIDAAKRLEGAGAECIALCANTAHNVAGKVQLAVSIPLISVVDATVAAIQKQGLQKVILLGTRFTMQKPFFKDTLQQSGFEVVLPNTDDMNFIHASIFDELGKGIFTPATKAKYLSIIETLASTSGAQGVIFACTEIPMLIKREEVTLPVFDTTEIHVEAISRFVLQK